MSRSLIRYFVPTLVIIGMVAAVLGSHDGTTHAATTTPRITSQAAGQGPQLPSFADVVEQVSPAVVTITVSKSAASPETFDGPGGPSPLPRTPFDDFFGRFFDFPVPPQMRGPVQALGSGFFVDPDGYIVTNNHVIDGADDIAVILSDGTRLDATLVGRDPKTDLALLKVSGDTPFPALRFGDSEHARVGDWVLAIGNPFGLGGTATAGIISARGRDIRSGPYDDYLQIDAPINSGNSGGPILDAAGDVIGVNTAIYSPNGGNVGIGFAIPSNQAREIVDQLKVDRVVHRGWLGVQIQGMDDDLAASLGLASDEGALVADVTSDSPADKAGIAVGDVITRFGDRAIDSPRTLGRVVADQDPGSTVRVHVWRDGKDKTLKVTLKELEESGGVLASAPADTATGRLGLTLAPLSDRYRGRLGTPEDVDGVVVEAVRPGSEAAEKGLRPGDLITRVNGHEVSDPAAVASEIAAAHDDRVRVLVRRGDSQYFAALALS